MEARNQTERQEAGATEKAKDVDLHGKIVEFLWLMKKHGYKETTIRGKGKRLQVLVKLGANVDPESVKQVITPQNWKDFTKETTVHTYDSFVKWAGSKWEKPRYKAV